MGWETISIHADSERLKFPMHLKSKTSQFEIVFKSLAHFITQFRV